MRNPLEDTVENYLVKRVKAMGGIALKGDVKGQRFLDRIIILPNGRTIWCECKRPEGGRYSKHQEETLRRLTDMGHACARVKTKDEVDKLLNEVDGWGAPPPSSQMVGGLALISAERERQISKGYDAAHDDGHKGGEIIMADWGARARIEAAINAGRSGDSPAYKELLAQAAAQCVAEIDRVERAEGSADE